MKMFATVLFLCALTAQVWSQTPTVSAKELLPDALSFCRQEFEEDVFNIYILYFPLNFPPIVMEMDPATGKSTGWTYSFYSPSRDTIVTLIALPQSGGGVQMIFVQGSVGYNGDLATILADLSDVPMDSDDALFAIRNAPGYQAFAAGRNPFIEAAYLHAFTVNTPQYPAGRYWFYRFSDGPDTLLCSVNADDGSVFQCQQILGNDMPPVAAAASVGESYPNPVSLSRNASLLIPWTSVSRQPATLVVFDMLGHEVYRLDAEHGAAISIPVSVFHRPGVYFYTIKSGAEIFSRKLVVTR